MNEPQKQPSNNSKPESVSRRSFVSGVAASVAAGAVVSQSPLAGGSTLDDTPKKFTMKFAPHPGSFRASFGNKILDEIRYCHDQGFTAIEINGLPKQAVEMQEKIGKLLDELGMTMGVFVAYANFTEPTFARRNDGREKEVLEAIESSVAVAKRVNAKWMTVVPGAIDQATDGNKWGGGRLAEGYQNANTIDLLRRCAEILEPHELVMVLEPLNWHANHGGVFLRYSDHAYSICKAVNSPSCKILFDIYHQQITEGNLIPNIEMCWDEIAYFQAGDNPGRKEPGTGEINYANVFKYIHERATKEGKDFVVGMEHGNSIKGKEGEAALIAAYRAVDPS